MKTFEELRVEGIKKNILREDMTSEHLTPELWDKLIEIEDRIAALEEAAKGIQVADSKEPWIMRKRPDYL